MSYNVGINVVEVDGRVSRAIQPAETSVAGLVIRSARGSVPAMGEHFGLSDVVTVRSWDAFVARFGTALPDASGYFAVRGFFRNGGHIARIVRVVDPTSAAAWGDHVLPAPAVEPPPEGGEGDPPAPEPADPMRFRVEAAFRDQPDPGGWGNDLDVYLIPDAFAPGGFDLEVRLESSSAVLERWDDLTLASLPERLNHPTSGSRYIRLSSDDDWAAMSGPFDPAAENPAPIRISLANGSDTAADWAGLGTALRAGIDALAHHSVQLVACPESSDPAVSGHGIDHCATLGDRLFVGHTAGPDTCPDADGVIDWMTGDGAGQGLRQEKAYGALYAPWLEVPDAAGTGTAMAPPDGHVMGAMARIDRERGVWKSPAGAATRLSDVRRPAFKMSDRQHTAMANEARVNGIRALPGLGIVIDAGRTLSDSGGPWKFVGTRLLFNMVKSALRDSLRWAVHEPNSPGLWRRLEYGSIRPFLLSLWRRGAFGSGTPDESFAIKVDGDNNPPDQVKLGNLSIEVYFYPVRPAEMIKIVVGQRDAGASASES